MKQNRKITVLIMTLIFAVCLCACGGSSDGGTASTKDTSAAPLTNPAENVSTAVIDDFAGTWKFDSQDHVVKIVKDGGWEIYSTDGTFVGSAGYTFDNGVVTLLDSTGSAYIPLSISGSQLVDNNGNTLSRYEFTAPKAEPQGGDGGGGALSDTGDYGTTYYWYDSDGDVWFWNGYEDVFVGFGDDYYIEDGQYYESNDAGWDDDYDDYYDYYDPYYDDDYYDYYDPYYDPYYDYYDYDY